MPLTYEMRFYGDLHCDTLWRCYENRTDLEAPGLQVRRGLPFRHLQTYAIYIPDTEPDPYRYFRAVYAYAREMLRKYPEMKLCRNAREIDESFAAGQTPYLFSVEGGGFFGTNSHKNQRTAAELREKGVAFLSLCYNRGNHLAGGVHSEQGLTAAGREAALMLREEGITLDLSHLNRPSADALLALLPDHVAATHSNCFSLTPHPRNLSDEQIRAIGARSGLIGVNFYPPFLTGKNTAGIADILAHVRRITALAGGETAAFGSDFDGISRTPEDLPDTGALPRLAQRLFAEWGAEQTDAFLYGNMRRYLERSLR